MAPLQLFLVTKRQGIQIEMTFSALHFSDVEILPGNVIINLPQIFSLITVRHPITKDFHVLPLPDFSGKTARRLYAVYKKNY